MVDKNGALLSIGDWVKSQPFLRVLQVIGVEGEYLKVKCIQDGVIYFYGGTQLIKLTNEEAMIYLMET